MRLSWRPYGRNAVLVQFAEQSGAKALQARLQIIHGLENLSHPYLREFVPGFTDVLLEFSVSTVDTVAAAADEIVSLLEAHPVKKAPEAEALRIPVRYDGSDLQRVAEHNGLTLQKAIQLHSEAVYHVHLLGFSPGFPYLGELHPKLHTPRLASPRLRVEPGSVAIGGQHTGIYTVPSPGGWNIIGHTDLKLFDPTKSAIETESFMLRPGSKVQFVPIS